MAKWKEIKEITTEDESKKTEKKTKKYTGQFAPLLKIHTDRLAQAKEMNDSAKILTAEYEIDRINDLIAREENKVFEKFTKEMSEEYDTKIIDKRKNNKEK